jgi:TatD DNase family protein
MSLIDTHAHLDLLEGGVDQALERAGAAGVSGIIAVGIDLESSRRAIAFAKRFHQVRAVIGIHPHDASRLDKAGLRVLEQLAGDPRVVGIGETGLDFYRNRSPHEDQERAFRAQIELAKELGLAVVVHDRDAHADTMRILEDYQPFENALVLHCFSGELDMALACIEMGGYISVSGPVTFLNAKRLQEIVRELPLKRLLIETDSPFLSPHPFRGKPNSPERLVLIAEKVAELKGVSVQELDLPNPFFGDPAGAGAAD